MILKSSQSASFGCRSGAILPSRYEVKRMVYCNACSFPRLSLQILDVSNACDSEQGTRGLLTVYSGVLDYQLHGDSRGTTMGYVLRLAGVRTSLFARPWHRLVPRASHVSPEIVCTGIAIVKQEQGLFRAVPKRSPNPSRGVTRRHSHRAQ